MTCTHDIIEKDNACADGMCPICLAADNTRLMEALGQSAAEAWAHLFDENVRLQTENEQLKADKDAYEAEIHRLMQALVDAPVTGSSSQLLGVAAHRLQEALGVINRLEAQRDEAVRDVVRGAEKIKQLREELELVSK